MVDEVQSETGRLRLLHLYLMIRTNLKARRYDQALVVQSPAGRTAAADVAADVAADADADARTRLIHMYTDSYLPQRLNLCLIVLGKQQTTSTPRSAPQMLSRLFSAFAVCLFTFNFRLKLVQRRAVRRDCQKAFAWFARPFPGHA